MNKKIAYITDIHLDEEFSSDTYVDARKNWEIILNDISVKNIDRVIFGGDIGEKSANKWFFESLHNYNIDITLGNHDHFDEVIKHCDFGITKSQNELYYSRELLSYKLIFLDSSSGVISEKQFEWFKNELLTKKSIIVFIHHPILSLNVEVDKRFALKERGRIMVELLNVKKKITLFCGHYHFEDERSNENIQQYITPASSYQVEKISNEIKINNKTFGYRIIELSDVELKTELIMFI